MTGQASETYASSLSSQLEELLRDQANRIAELRHCTDPEQAVTLIIAIRKASGIASMYTHDLMTIAAFSEPANREC